MPFTRATSHERHMSPRSSISSGWYVQKGSNAANDGGGKHKQKWSDNSACVDLN
jgi:hypothetical protein